MIASFNSVMQGGGRGGFPGGGGGGGGSGGGSGGPRPQYGPPNFTSGQPSGRYNREAIKSGSSTTTNTPISSSSIIKKSTFKGRTIKIINDARK
jgi:hypothetical protein